jgi:hypothetical protein
MIAIITGDITNSRLDLASKWQTTFKETLNRFGPSPSIWEIYRGDSFQLMVGINESLATAVLLKASIKQHPLLDVRMAIGIGESAHQADRITESNGSAYIYSGECFERLKKNQLAVQTENAKFNTNINMMLNLASLTMNQWTVKQAILVYTALTHPELGQKALAKKMSKSQSTISKALNRAGFDEIQNLIRYFEENVNQQ